MFLQQIANPIFGEPEANDNAFQTSEGSKNKKLNKFSIGKDLNLTLTDIENILAKFNNSNITELLFNEILNASDEIIVDKRMSPINVNLTENLALENDNQSTTISIDSTTTTANTLPDQTTPLTITTTSVLETLKTTESLAKKIERIKNKLKAIHKLKDKRSFRILVDEILANADTSKLNKGRSTEETKVILNYMITALYTKRTKALQNDSEFDTNKFFDDV